MNLSRRRFLHLAASTAATTTLAQLAAPIAVRALPSVLPKRPARDRLEEALTRIADPRGEGARACLTVYADTARAAADAADARASAGLSLAYSMLPGSQHGPDPKCLRMRRLLRPTPRSCIVSAPRAA
jgi:hypothetical protein